MSIRSITGLTAALTLAATLVLGADAHAQNAATAAGGYKIGIVDMQRVLAQSKERTAKYDALQREVDALQADITALSNKIEANKKAYEAESDGEKRFALKQQIDADFATYRTELDKRQAEIDRKEEAVLKEVLDDVQNSINQVAKSGNYHLILNGSIGPRSSVLFYDPTVDITSQVLTVVDGGASAAPAPAAESGGKKKNN